MLYQVSHTINGLIVCVVVGSFVSKNKRVGKGEMWSNLPATKQRLFISHKSTIISPTINHHI